MARPNPEKNMTQAERRVVRALASALRHRCGVREGDALLVACSGGADSVAMLRALHALAPRRRWKLRLHVAHVQHHLRNDSAERDAEFVAELAKKLGLPFHRVDLDLAKEGGSRNLEARARRARYAALNGLAGHVDARPCAVVTGHHADDQLETVLMRLMRGSAVHGLRGIAWRRKVPVTAAAGEFRASLLRPLLGVTREALRVYLDAIGQPWVEDETNRDVSRMRARLRNTVTPELHAMANKLPERLAALTDHARDVSRLLRECASGLDLPLDRGDARRMNPAVLTEVLRDALIRAGELRDRCTANALRPALKAIRDEHGGDRRFAFARHELRVTAKSVSLDEKGQTPEAKDVQEDAGTESD